MVITDRLSTSPRLPWLPWAVALVPGLVGVAIIIGTGPFFGNMDDGLLLELAANQNPLTFANNYGWRPASGFINDASMLIVWPSYWIGAHWGPLALFVVNALLVLGVIGAFGFALHRVGAIRGALGFTAFMSAAYLWPYTGELLFFPSLQEKGVILGAALLLLWSGHAARFASTTLYWASLVAVVLIAFSTKTHIVLFVPAVLYVLVRQAWEEPRRLGKARALGAAALLVAASLILGYLAMRGTYSSGTRGSQPISLSRLADSRCLILIVILGLYVIGLLVRARAGVTDKLSLLPVFLLGSVIASFPLWDYRNYYLSVVGVMVGATAAMALRWVSSRGLAIGFVTALLLSSCAWQVVRLPQVLGPLASLGAFLANPVAQSLAGEDADVYVSCLEAPSHFARYAVREQLTGLSFSSLVNLDPGSPQPRYILADSKLCPFNDINHVYEAVWESGIAGGYVLLRLK